MTLIRSPDGRPYVLLMYNFTVLLISAAAKMPPNKIQRFANRPNSNLRLGNFDSPSPNFRGAKKCEIWPRFSTPLDLSRLHFEIKQRIVELDALRMDLSSHPQIESTSLRSVDQKIEQQVLLFCSTCTMSS